METLVIINNMISKAVQLSEDHKELKLAEEALMNEDEWKYEEAEVSSAQDDLADLMNILKELDIESRDKNIGKPATKKKLSQKQQQIQNAARNSKKITDFFSRKENPPVVEKEDSRMEWEDNMMDWDNLPTPGWSAIMKMEKSREKAKRWRRARIQKLALLQSLERKSQERQEISAWIVDEILDSWEKKGQSTRMETVVATSDMAWTVAITHEINKGGWERTGTIDAKKYRINWRLAVNIQPVQEIRQQEREHHIR